MDDLHVKHLLSWIMADLRAKEAAHQAALSLTKKPRSNAKKASPPKSPAPTDEVENEGGEL